MEKLTINIKRCEECEHWEKNDLAYSTGFCDDTYGYCHRKNIITNFLDGCIDTTEIREGKFWFVLFADGTSRDAVYGLE